MSSKTISMSLGYIIANATITTDMSEEDIYNALRSAFAAAIDPSLHIAIYYPTSDEKIALRFPALKENVTYRIELASARIQGSGSASAGSVKTRHNVDEIRKHWGLDEASEILPAHIARPKDPAAWPKRVTDELRGLSARSKGRRDLAVWCLQEEEVKGRVERDSGSPHEVMCGDVKRAVKRMLEYMASEAGDIVLFAGGGLKEALDEAEMEKEDEDGEDEIAAPVGQWTMKLASHLKK